ncbi:MAG: helix-turn-helix domain-containing protein [Bacilli bacterium]|jgi:AraC-like DNA-binding protein
MTKGMIQPYIRLARNDEEKQGWTITRSIWDYELIYVAEGEMSVVIGDRNYVAKKDNLIFLRPREKHTLIANTDIAQPHIHFDFYKDHLSDKIVVSFKTVEIMTDEEKTWFRNDDLKEMQMNFPTVIKVHNYPQIKNLLFQIIDEYCFKNEFHDLYISSLMIQMLIMIVRGLRNARLPSYNKNPAIFDDVIAFILRNFERNPSLDELSAVANLSKYHFLRVFQKRFKMTPHAYIQNLRLDRSKEYLQYYNEHSISNIASALNFDSVSSFCNWFIKHQGVTPMEYRKQKNKMLWGDSSETEKL